MTWWWIVGCASEGLAPLVEARGGGAGYWPPNGRTAIEGAAASGFDGLELDLVLTRDRVPVLVDGPWILPERCAGPEGQPIAPILVRRLTLAQLVDGYRCGGIPDPDFPNALVVPEAPMTLDQALDLLHRAPPSMVVHLDLHQDPGETVRAEVFAEQILDRWAREDLPQAMYVTSPRPEVLGAFDSHGRVLGLDVPTALVFPDPDSGSTLAELLLAAEAERWANGLDYLAKAQQSGADGLSIHWELAERSLIDAARREGLTIGIWTVDRPLGLAEWTAPGRVDAVITSYPGDVP